MRARWLGRVPYAEAWDLQRSIAGRSDDDYLLLLEHGPVYTLGAHADPTHVLVDPASVGAELVTVDRGGDVTYHGPGQLVGYPVRTVGPGPHRGPEHVRQVEQVVIGALVGLGVPSERVGRLDGYPGVWIDPSATGAGGAGPRKVAAIGVRTARGRTTHGFGLNITTDLSMFGHIVPCGIADRPVTSLAAEGFDATMAEAVRAVLASARSVWGEFDDTALVTDGAASGGVRPTGGGDATGSGGPTDGRGGTGGTVDTGDRVAVSFRGAGAGAGSALRRRLTRSGVDPDAGLPISARKPEWLRVQATMAVNFLGLQRDIRDLGLVTVCEEAGCPNIFECWSDGTATFMINGSRCTRACGFCQVDTRHPLPLDVTEPDRVADAVARMGLAHAVITCVARDDLPDGGAGAFAETISAVRRASPGTAVEVLISDVKGDRSSLDTILDARPDVLNHNIETVARLQRAVRPSAGYARSLTVLARSAAAGLTTKSGIILGMGEREDEVVATLADLRAVGVEIVTLGQYLRPSMRHLPVARWWTPEEFDRLRRAGQSLGFAHVQASPLTRSSYHAREAADASTGGAPVTVTTTGARS
jgi:lipoic acid synthetase